MSDLEALLARFDPGQYPIPKELGSSAQEELLARYRESVSMTERYRLLQVLTLVGNTNVTELITNTLTRDFAGQSVNSRERAHLEGLTRLLALVAQSDDAALAFLSAGVQPAFWERIQPWNCDPQPNLSRACARALPFARRPETGAVLDDLGDHLEGPRE